ncbi:hypothetical protein [Rheinheimera sp.]|uniref:hypothetical protein n=1 Tax=Rheinheimera sp. TaxID=1869214 RepID=UPI0027B9825A|nr:hypothetical protein [Rheinheimera sp.]
MKILLPKQWLNAAFFYLGCLGLLFQISAQLMIWWQGYDHPGMPWYIWLAPMLLILWGVVPALQLQNELPHKSGEVTLKL